METTLLDIDTSGQHFVDLTPAVASFCKEMGSGLCHVFVPHATAGLALMELGARSDSDLSEVLSRLLPRDDRWAHRHGSFGHGADHVLPAFISPSISIPVIDGEQMLGTWQSVVLIDTNDDNPRRSVRLSFLSS